MRRNGAKSDMRPGDGGGGVFQGRRTDYVGRMIWVVATAMAVMAAALLARAAQSAVPEAEAAPNARVYRDQLKEIARDAARGVIPAEEAARLRAEVARRLLAADRPAAPAATVGPRGPVLALSVAVPVFTLLTYVGTAPLLKYAGLGEQRIEALSDELAITVRIGGYSVHLTPIFVGLGAPGYPDLPMRARLAAAAELAAARPSQVAAEAAAPALPPVAVDAALVAQVEDRRARVAAQPDDLESLRFLAVNEAGLGNLSAAREAQAQAVAVLGDAATPSDRAMLAWLMVAAAGGTVTAEADAVLAQVLSADDAQDVALYLAGIGQMQVGRPDLAFRLWRRYLEVAPQGSPWRADVAARMQPLAAAAGVDWVPLAAAAGPTAADLAAAAEMSEEERQAMAAGMVARLEGRLAAEGGSAADWARLIAALGVLGERARAKAVYAEAATTFAGRDADLAVILAAARQAGVAE